MECPLVMCPEMRGKEGHEGDEGGEVMKGKFLRNALKCAFEGYTWRRRGRQSDG